MALYVHVAGDELSLHNVIFSTILVIMHTHVVSVPNWVTIGRQLT